MPKLTITLVSNNTERWLKMSWHKEQWITLGKWLLKIIGLLVAGGSGGVVENFLK